MSELLCRLLNMILVTYVRMLARSLILSALYFTYSYPSKEGVSKRKFVHTLVLFIRLSF